MAIRLFRLVALLALFAMIAAACGGDDDTDEATDDTAADAAADDAAADDAAADDAAADDGAADDAAADDAAADDGAADDAAADDAAADDGAADDGGADGGGGEGGYDDPRGALFSDFQAGFDRSHPFQSLDAFCVAHDAAADRTDTDDGITADSITVVHLRSKLEQLADIGFAVPIGNPTDMFEAFAAAINDCGGIRGRTIDLQLVEVDAFAPGEDIDALRNAACIEATEDRNAVIVMNSTGFQGSANLCLVEEAGVAFISTQGQSAEFMERGEDRLISLSPTLEESLQFLANDLIASGALEGATIGVVAPDTPGQAEAVEAGLVTPLEDAGLNVAVFDVIGCGGSTTCTEGIPESVTRMIDAGVDTVFPTLNVVSSPQYLGEMVTQGITADDVQFYNSDFNSQAGELTTSKIVSFGGAAAGELYNGALIVDDADTGGYRVNGFDPVPFDAMCHATYAEYSPAGESWVPEDAARPGGWGMTLTVCAEMRMMARAIYDAGDNPTRDDIYAALANLGPVDLGDMLPATVVPGKTQAPDVVHTLEFTYPCDDFPYGEEQICITPIDEYRPAPR